MKTRLWAEWVALSEELSVLTSWFWRPTSRNLVKQLSSAVIFNFFFSFSTSIWYHNHWSMAHCICDNWASCLHHMLQTIIVGCSFTAVILCWYGYYRPNYLVHRCDYIELWFAVYNVRIIEFHLLKSVNKYWTLNNLHVFMAALCNRAGHYIFALWFLSFFLLLSSFFPRLISAAADWKCTILTNMVWP